MCSPPCSTIENHAECKAENVTVELICTSEDNEAIQHLEKFFYALSVFILVVFELELLAFLYLLGFFQFLINFTNIFDALIVTLSLALEIALHNSEEGAIIGVIIFARFWRLIRISHGILYSSETRRKALGESLAIRESNQLVAEESAKNIQNIEARYDA